MATHMLANMNSGGDRLPDFDEIGHLPEGIHSTTLSALARAVRFNEHRRKMWVQLCSFLVDPVVKHKFSAVYVGGGYVSTKQKPSDIDLVLETASPYGPQAFEAVAPFFVTGLDKILMIYGVHLQFWMRGAPSGLTDYLAFFQRERPDHSRHFLHRPRGIVRIDLNAEGMIDRLRRYIRGENTAAIPIDGDMSGPTLEDEIDRMCGIKRHLARMAVNVTKLVIVTDAWGRIEWVNECFVRTCGFTLREARGQKPGYLLQGPASDRDTIQLLRRAVAEARECECEITNYRKDRSTYSVRIMMSPIYEAGVLAGFLAVEEKLGETETLLSGGYSTQQAA